MADAPTAAARGRVRAIDWLRGLVMILMTIDHAGRSFDAYHIHNDSGHEWIAGTPLPAGEFLTRWLTHVCAPAFVLLAGASLALSTDKRRERPGQTAFIVKRGLLIAALDPAWMSLAFTGYAAFVLQVLFAIGMSMVAMAWLRRLPSPALLAGALGLVLSVEWLGARFPDLYAHGPASVWQTPARYLVGAILFNGGPLNPRMSIVCGYPIVPWLSMMMAGWVLGRWILDTRARGPKWQARRLGAVAAALLALFALVRGVDGYGNGGLHRDSMALLQWLHVAKYPPSLSYSALELGLTFALLGLFFVVDDDRPRRWLAPLGLLGATAFFYYLLHIHLLALARQLLHVDRQSHGLCKTYLGTAGVVLALYPLCARYRRYKMQHPDGWTRYI
jgi:uncharacterized membrane protein